jgi:hypothetical protein
MIRMALKMIKMAYIQVTKDIDIHNKPGKETLVD